MSGVELAFAGAVIASVFALVDPFGTLPIYTALTHGFSAPDVAKVRLRSVLVVGVVLGVFAIAGQFLFSVFGFTLAAFQIAGGILVFLISYEMLQGKIGNMRLSAEDRAEPRGDPEELAIVPIGIPLLAGPGAISTVMIYEGTAGGDPWEILATFVAIAIAVVGTWVVFRLGETILRRMGRVGVMAVARVMGLILAAVGVQFVVNGILKVFPGV
jgi:multiple antibiotic resistance protein